jgi:hypothetical protein
MKNHELKTDHQPFSDVFNGLKSFEIRKDDRHFSVNDTLHLRETYHTGEEMAKGAPLDYTGRELLLSVTHKLTGYGLLDGWCIMSIRILAYDPGNG